VLDVQQEIMMIVRCEPFNTQTELNNDDRISIVWTNAPDDTQKVSASLTGWLRLIYPPRFQEFRYEWLQGDGMVRRKNLQIVYNL